MTVTTQPATTALPAAATDAGAAATIAGNAPASKAPQTVSLSALSAVAIRAANPTPAGAGTLWVQNLAARQTAHLKQVRGAIAAMAPNSDDDAIYHAAQQDVNQLIQIWFNGTKEAVSTFHTALVPDDQQDQSAALLGLVGNLAWAIAALASDDMAGWVAVNQAVVALMTPPGGSPSARQQFRDTASLIDSRLNAIFAKLNAYSDVVAYSTVNRVGFAAFHKLDHIQQEQTLWSAMFDAPVATADGQGFQEAIRVRMATVLAQADAHAVAHLKQLRTIWRSCLVPVVMPTGDLKPSITLFDVDPKRWSEQTGDPMAEYTCLQSVPTHMVPSYADDPCPTPGVRAATLLDIAIMHTSPFARILSSGMNRVLTQ